jgi:hypothetical protein
VLFSQDGHLLATVDLLGHDAFWRDEVGVPPPAIRGLGRAKLVEIAAASFEPPAGGVVAAPARLRRV